MHLLEYFVYLTDVITKRSYEKCIFLLKIFNFFPSKKCVLGYFDNLILIAHSRTFINLSLEAVVFYINIQTNKQRRAF